MPRSTNVEIELDSDRDLTKLSCRRVTIETIAPGRFKVTSSLRFYRCEVRTFLHRLLTRRLPGYTYITGGCSAPTGYFWGPFPTK